MTRRGERRVRPADAQRGRGRDRAARGGRARPRQARGSRRAPAAAAVRRPAAARRARPRARHQSRRCCCSTSRCRTSTSSCARRCASRSSRSAAPARHHDRLRHPRPGRGAGHVRPHRGDERRTHRAGRRSGRDLRAPATRFVAEFIGRMNLFNGVVTPARGVRLASGSEVGGDLFRTSIATGAAVHVAIRPERARLSREKPRDGLALRGHRAAACSISARRASSTSTSPAASAASSKMPNDGSARDIRGRGGGLARRRRSRIAGCCRRQIGRRARRTSQD